MQALPLAGMDFFTGLSPTMLTGPSWMVGLPWLQLEVLCDAADHPVHQMQLAATSHTCDAQVQAPGTPQQLAQASEDSWIRWDLSR